jgi:hypothetical protein
MSTNPGATIKPPASISRPALALMSLATAMIRPPAIATSATKGSRPVPSTTEPPRTIRSRSPIDVSSAQLAPSAL